MELVGLISEVNRSVIALLVMGLHESDYQLIFEIPDTMTALNEGNCGTSIICEEVDL